MEAVVSVLFVIIGATMFCCIFVTIAVRCLGVLLFKPIVYLTSYGNKLGLGL